MYVVLWLRGSGLELKETHAFEDSREALKKFIELEGKATGSSFTEFYSAQDLSAGKKLFTAAGTDDIVHAFKVETK